MSLDSIFMLDQSSIKILMPALVKFEKLKETEKKRTRSERQNTAGIKSKNILK